jgi:hypothetical protein
MSSTSTAGFLDRPSDLPLVHELEKLLRFWLEGNTVPPSSATAIRPTLPRLFCICSEPAHRAVRARFARSEKDWRANAKSYRPLADALDTPFAKAADREQSCTRYGALPQRRIEASSSRFSANWKIGFSTAARKTPSA